METPEHLIYSYFPVSQVFAAPLQHLQIIIGWYGLGFKTLDLMKSQIQVAQVESLGLLGAVRPSEL